MRLALDLNWIVTVLLAAVRIGVVFVLTPLLAFAGTPPSFRTFFVLGLSALLVAGLAVHPGPLPQDPVSLARAALGETLLGGALAFGLLTGFAAFQLAGRLLDLQLGFGVAALIDPNTRAATPLLGTLLFMTGVIAFFAMDGHHMVVRGLAYSLERVPPGTPLENIELNAVAAQFGAMFSFALALAAPVVFVLLLTDVALAIMARSMPQLNVFFVSLPLKILVGLLVLAVSVPHLGGIARRLYESMFSHWEAVLG